MIELLLYSAAGRHLPYAELRSNFTVKLLASQLVSILSCQQDSLHA